MVCCRIGLPSLTWALDLHFGNILLQLPSTLDHLSDQQFYDRFRPPDHPETVARVDGKPLSPGVPLHVFQPVWMGGKSQDIALSEARILLIDFGTMFSPAHESRFSSCTPLPIRPPEAHLEQSKSLSFPSDIWSLGCAIWEILGHRGFLDSWIWTEDEIILDQVDALGPLPAEWWEKWEARSEWFPGEWQPRDGRWTFDRRFEESIQWLRRETGLETLSDEERDALFEMVRWMLSFRPGERPSAKQVLETDWMRKWAIPEYEKTWSKDS